MAPLQVCGVRQRQHSRERRQCALGDSVSLCASFRPRAASLTRLNRAKNSRLFALGLVNGVRPEEARTPRLDRATLAHTLSIADPPSNRAGLHVMPPRRLPEHGRVAIGSVLLLLCCCSSAPALAAPAAPAAKPLRVNEQLTAELIRLDTETKRCVLRSVGR